MQAMIETRGIRVDYDDVTAVRDLDLAIGPGEIYGLIGPNGAGKTSTIRVLATLQEPTYGDVHICGIDAFGDRRGVHGKVAYMPDLAPVYDGLRCWEFLDLFAAAHFIDRRTRRERLDEVLDQVDLTSKRNAFCKTLSRGMRQRLVLAKTVLTDPKVLLLDEPASGVDPIGRIDLRKMLRRQADLGKAILVSSHILTELGEMCTSIGIMEKGELRLTGALDEVVGRLGDRRRIVAEVVGGAASLAERLGRHDAIASIEAEDDRLAFDLTAEGDDDVVALLRELVAEGFPIRAFAEKRRGVEDVMLEIGAREVS
jgi:ABC-2 type transport system ATP-binding protein